MNRLKKHGTYRSTERRRWFECDYANRIGETIIVEAGKCDLDFKHPYSLGAIWKRNGRVDGTFDTYWHINTYVRRPNGDCHGGYNPCEMTYKTKPDSQGYQSIRPVIDFDWMLEATDENLERVLEEVYRRFMVCEPRKVVGDEYFARA